MKACSWPIQHCGSTLRRSGLFIAAFPRLTGGAGLLRWGWGPLTSNATVVLANDAEQSDKQARSRAELAA